MPRAIVTNGGMCVKNPILKCDYPDPDVIRVDDTYYMLSTTMHFFPGGTILRSYDLLHWEILSYLYDVLADTEGARLEDNLGIYGQGMWAPTLRYHDETFYVCFVANDTHKTYLFYTKDIEGTWERQEIEGFYHDPSLLFDKGKVYIVYGNTEIYITELRSDLTGPLEGGLHRMLVRDPEKVHLGYEGTHIYRINGKYYIFLIHFINGGNQRRTQACYVGDSLTGEFKGGEVLDDDMGYHNSGVAQGGIVDTPDGKWFGISFQDSGAVGRIPVLVPVHFKNDFPVFGENGVIPKEIELPSLRPSYQYEPLFTSNFVDERGVMKKQWQWNHLPESSLYQLDSTSYTITTNKLSTNIAQAVNTLTQRLPLCRSEVSVTVDASRLKDGDFAGISAFQSSYAHLAITKEDGAYFLVLTERNIGDVSQNMTDKDTFPGNETVRIPLESNASQVTLRMTADFSDMRDEVWFSYRNGGTSTGDNSCDDFEVAANSDSSGEWQDIGTPHKLAFTLDHFVGCRIGLFMYSTKTVGGSCKFTKFAFDGWEKCV